MARDHSPKERQRQQLLRRKQRSRIECDRVLIVSEGSKTEPLYFNEIRIEQRLPSANIAVSPSELGTEPMQVVQYARQLFEKGDPYKSIEPRAFEQIFAVFDRDDHKSYFEALKLAESLDGRLRNDARQLVTFKAIASVPSFELWLLLHFEQIQAPLHRDEVMQRLKLRIPGYEKGAGKAYETTRTKLNDALLNAGQLSEKFSAATDPEPYTGIADLVEILTHLRG